jgi:predicted ATPase
VWGDPGSGKSFLCDMFYETLDIGDRKVRMHYSEFLLKVHEMEHAVNQKLKGKTGETIAIVGNQMS